MTVHISVAREGQELVISLRDRQSRQSATMTTRVRNASALVATLGAALDGESEENESEFAIDGSLETK